MTQPALPRIAVIGCGAIARSFHLPALIRHPEIVPHLILVDRDAGRARELATEFGIRRTAANYSEILPDVDGVVVTLPHNLRPAGR